MVHRNIQSVRLPFIGQSHNLFYIHKIGSSAIPVILYEGSDRLFSAFTLDSDLLGYIESD